MLPALNPFKKLGQDTWSKLPPSVSTIKGTHLEKASKSVTGTDSKAKAGGGSWDQVVPCGSPLAPPTFLPGQACCQAPV